MKTDLLIVVDMQRDFISGALGSAEARAIVPAVAARIRRAKEEGTPVVFTLDTHEENYMDTREGRFLPVPHCIRGTEGWALEPEIAKECARGMLSFEKPTFGSTALMHHIAALALEKGAVGGMGMNIELRLFAPIEAYPGKKSFVGILKSYADEAITLDTPDGEVTVPHKAVSKAKTVYDFN